MNRPIRHMRTLGPDTEKTLAEIDIFHEDDLRALGAFSAFQRLKFRFGRHASILALCAIEAAPTGRD